MQRRKTLSLLGLLLVTAALSAAYMQIETTHTKIIFEEEFESHAQVVAGFADEVYEELAGFLNYQQKPKVPVVLAAKTAWANGFFSPFPATIILYLTSPDNLFLGSRTENWLRSLYVHELTHYLHLTQYLGPAKYLRIFGPGVAMMSTIFMPGWWIEGITTYTESNFAAGGRGSSLSFALDYQVPYAQNSMWSLGQGSYGGPFHPSSRIYNTGYLMVDYLIRTYGIEAFIDINNKFSIWPFFGMGGPFKKVTGYTDKELFQFALAELPDLEPSSATRLSPKFEGHSYLPTKTAIGLIGYREGVYAGSGLYSYDNEKRSSQILQLSLNKGSSISFGEEKAVFSHIWADTTDPSYLQRSPVGYSDLYLLDLKTLEQKRLTHKQRLVHPAISYDGTRIVASLVDGPFYRLVHLDPETGTVETLYESEGASYLQSSLNKDGSLLATIKHESGNSSILLLETGREARTLLGPTSDELRSVVFTDQNDLLFISDRNGIYSVYRYDLTRSEIQLLFSDSYGIFSARLIDGMLIYESLSKEGRVLKQVDASLFKNTDIDSFAPMTIGSEYPQASYEVKRYYDIPMVNLILPFPFIDANRFSLGAYFDTSSPLGRHSLVGNIGYEFSAARPVASITYQTSLGRSAFQLAANINTYDAYRNSYYSTAVGTLGYTLYAKTTTTRQLQLALQPQLEFSWNETSWTASSLLFLGGISQSEDVRRADFFGPSSLRASAGVQLSYQDSSSSFYARSFLSFAAQQRLFKALPMLNVAMDVALAPKATVQDAYPLFSFTPQEDGEVKLRLTSSYRLPLSLLDVSVPYGGLTGIGLELSAQSAWYLAQGELLWEGVWALGAKLSANMVLTGTSISVRPFVMLNYAFGLDSWQFTLGLDNQNIFTVLGMD